MRNTPVEEYLEEISTTLSEETYGRLSDAIYETNCEFDEEVASYRAENAKLRKVAKMMLLTLKSKGIVGGIFTYPDRNSNAEEWVTFESYLRKFGIEA